MMKNIQYFFCATIYTLLLLPGLGLITDMQTSNSCEKRSLQEWPGLKANKHTGKELEAYFRDHASFRNQWQQLYSQIKYKLFNSSSKPTEVIVGKDNWMYYSSQSDKLIASYARTDLWKKSSLINKVESWEKRQADLAKKNKSYHVAIWPNKPTIYSEHLPEKMKRLVRDTISKTDQILRYCNETNSSVTPLDVRPLLMEKKDLHKIYHKHDSHWNALGAFYAYQALMQDLGMEPYAIEDFEIEWKTDNNGDLTALMGLCKDDTQAEEIPVLTFKGTDKSQKVKPETGPSYYINPESKSNMTILVFRDSYFSALIPYLSLHFRQAYYPWSYYDEEMVRQLDPDIVLSANVERRL